MNQMEPLRNRDRPFGASVRRNEDPRVLLGKTQYVDDIRLPDMLSVAFVRSHYAHARLTSVDVAAARAMPGVVAVYTAADLGAALPRFKIAHDPASGFPPHRLIEWPALPLDKVRYVGEPIVAVVATDRYVAEDAAALVTVDYAPLPVVADMEQALTSDTVLVHNDWIDNIYQAVETAVGDLDAAFAAADVVVSDRFLSGRHMAMPLEGRGIVAAPDRATDGLTIWASTQMPHVLRSHMAQMLRFPEQKLRLISADVGGAFGLKAHIFAEDFLIPLFALKLGRPVKWVEDRREHLIGSLHAKHQIVDGALALRKDGKILGLRADILCDMGAYTEYPWPNYEAHITATALAVQYKLPAYGYRSRTVVTNKTPSGAYRGIGQPIAVFVLERLLEMAARKLGLDPAHIRRINMIADDEYPYQTLIGTEIESGSHRRALDLALERIDYAAFRREQEAARAEGRYLGLGIAHYVEMTAPGTPVWKMIGARMSGFEPAMMRIELDGRVTVAIGVNSQGQAHETVFAQLAADELGVAFNHVRVIQGDTQATPRGGAVGGSKSAVVTGGAVILAARKLRLRLLEIVAAANDIAVEALELDDGNIRRKSDGHIICTIGAAAENIWLGNWGMERDEKGLEVLVHYEPPPLSHGNAVHMATVAVDAETGAVELLRYVVVEDCGKLINPRVVDGQVQGGVAQGIGQALYEEVVHDANGQLLTGTLMDYLLPTAVDVPAVEISHLETPSPHTVGGIKGAGEGGKIAPGAAIANAVADALLPFAARVTQLPLTPERVLALIDGGSLKAVEAAPEHEAAAEGLRISGSYRFAAPRDKVWAFLTDPYRLAACLPGCQKLDVVGENEYRGEIKIGLAAIKGLYNGRVKLSNLTPPSHYDILVDGQGKQGFVRGWGALDLADEGSHTTLTYGGTVEVGGPLAGVGQRMFDAAAKLILGQFFAAMEAELTAAPGRRARQGVLINFWRYLWKQIRGWFVRAR